MSLLGSAAGEVARDFGIRAGTKLAAAQIAKVPGRVLARINQAVGTRLVTKAGSTGLVNLTKLVPVVGGIVGGGLNVLFTRQIGRVAVGWLREGPNPTVTDDGPIIDGNTREAALVPAT
jgi:hypothetical protein